MKKEVLVYWDCDSMTFENFGGKERFKKLIEKTANEFVRSRILKDSINKEIFYFDRITHSEAIEFFTLAYEDDDIIVLKRTGGIS